MSAAQTPVDIGLSLVDVAGATAGVLTELWASADLSALAGWSLVALPALTGVLVVLNLLTWSRGPRRALVEAAEKVSVLIPARNEEANIAECLAAVLDPAAPPLEVLVYDDRSTDGTADVVRALSARHDRLHLIEGGPLPRRWNGKSHACHQLAGQAEGELLLFVDADVRLAPGAIARVGQAFDEDEALAVLTAVPRQQVVSWLEQLVVPLLHVTYLSWLWLPLIRLVLDPRVLAANGQLLAVKRAAYDAFGGYGSVGHEMVDDMALCRRAKQAGHPVAFLDGHTLATCRMYEDAAGVWEGFSKNLYAGLGARPAALIAAVTLYAACFVAPFVALALAWWWPTLLLPAATASVCVIVTRALIARRFAHPAWTVLALPLAVLILIAVAGNSLRWFYRGDVRWRGRRYTPDAGGGIVATPLGAGGRS